MATKKQPKPVDDEQIKTYLPALVRQRRGLPNLGFEDKSDAKFSKWSTLTENIIIACFGRESSQHDQFKKLVYKLVDHGELATSWHDLSVSDFKRKMTDLLDNFIKELELRVPVRNANKSNITVKMVNNQSVTQNINIKVTINNLLESIKENEPDLKKVAEAEKELKEFEAEISKEKPQWAKVKKTLEWLLNFSKEAFIQVLPLIVEKYLTR